MFTAGHHCTIAAFSFYSRVSPSAAVGISSGLLVILSLKASDTLSLFTQINFTVNVLTSRTETLCLRVKHRADCSIHLLHCAAIQIVF